MSIPDLLSIRQVALPEVSPDGRAVLYTVRAWEDATGKDAGKKNARTHVWRVASDGTGQRQLTFSEPGETAPAWSPDGSLISFVSARGADSAGDDGPRAQIWIMPSDGGEARKLTDAKESVTGYAWSPDGTKIAYVSRDPLPKDREDKRKRRDDATVFEGDFRMSHLWVDRRGRGPERPALRQRGCVRGPNGPGYIRRRRSRERPGAHRARRAELVGRQPAHRFFRRADDDDARRSDRRVHRDARQEDARQDHDQPRS